MAGGGWLFDLSFIDAPSRERISRMLMAIYYNIYMHTCKDGDGQRSRDEWDDGGAKNSKEAGAVNSRLEADEAQPGTL